MATPADLALLVDSHTLDSYVALAALRPARAWLLHAPDYQPRAEALATTCRHRLGVECELVEVADDTSVDALDAAWRRLPAATHLHHTGGSGAMAPLLYAAHVREGRPATAASWLDEGRRLLRRADGHQAQLGDLIDPAAVDVAAILSLQRFSERPDPHDAERHALVAEVIGRLRPGNHSTGRTLLEAISRELGQRVAGRNSRHWTTWAQGGGFFEDVVEWAVRQVAPEHDTRTGVSVQRDLTAVELDVVAVGRFRPYVISCTRGGKPETIKHKMFEVLHRAEQVGGLTARSAVACTLTDGASIPPSAIESLVRWSPVQAHQPLVFGDTDVAGWLRGEQVALDRLQSFLTD